jgi:hypothetical protein
MLSISQTIYYDSKTLQMHCASANLFRIKIYVLGFKNIAGLGGWLND